MASGGGNPRFERRVYFLTLPTCYGTLPALNWADSARPFLLRDGLRGVIISPRLEFLAVTLPQVSDEPKEAETELQAVWQGS